MTDRLAAPAASARSWWHRQYRPFDAQELAADATVHAVGIAVAVAGGSVLLRDAAIVAPDRLPGMVLYVATLLLVLSVSLAFNQCPPRRVKMHLAKVDQASIFLFVAGSYTPFLTILPDTAPGTAMLALVWGLSLAGAALKLVVPHRFGRVAIPLYLAVGWSGLLVFDAIAASVTERTLALLLAGGASYSVGVVFHLWERLRFQNVLWHVAVVAGASMHLAAVIETVHVPS